MNRLFLLAGLLFGVTLVAPGCTSSTSPAPQAPQASSWRIQAGGSAANEAFQGLAYYPSSTLTIDAGDTVTWSFPAGEPHTVSLLGAGQKLPAGSDPNNSNPAGGKTYDGTTFVSSGFKLLGGSYSLQFTKPGTYVVYCLIHQPEMVQTIVVQPAFTPYPHPQSFYDTAGASALSSDLAAATASVSLFPYEALGLHLAAGISPSAAGGQSASSTVMRFLSTTDITTQTATVPVGSTVTWTNLSNNSPHTVTFGPAGQPFPTLNPFSPPSGGTVYDGTKLVNSGPLFPGQSVSFTFTKAGTYVYHCIFHDDTENMISTLIVQ